MTRIGGPTFVLFSLLVTSFATLCHGHDLTFEDRVNAQEAIERVYYAHQVGAARPFEEALPRAVLEAKVRSYLKKSAALERFWDREVTGEMLERELERMGRGTLMPQRLHDLYVALGEDSVLIQECLVRPVLVDRLVRESFSGNTPARGSALERAGHPPASPGDHVRAAVNASGSLTLDGDPLDGDGSEANWDAWWARVSPGLDERLVRTVANSVRLPALPARGLSCLPDDTWEPMSGNDAPLGRINHRAVWTGNLMIVWGGQGSGGLFGSGCRYDPTTDAWSPMSVSGAPSGRVYFSSVWTGSEMIVWGGYVGLPDRLNTGGRYDPLTDSWLPMTVVGAPLAREKHSAVWTGSEMIVWGGFAQDASSTTVSRTGGSYDPAADTWRSLPTTGAPPARYGHSAVWTGRDMLVWGGATCNPITWTCQDLASGGRFDPQMNSWSTMPAGGSFTAGIRPAVWTGQELIVWGGFERTGGRLDPEAGIWEPIETLGAPAGYSGESAVWTGSRLLVWGGFDGTQNPSNLVDSGGRYDPVSNSWTSISTDGAPAARFAHSAVWSGDQMLVWGGATEYQRLNTGGGYSFGQSTDNDGDGTSECDGDCDDGNGSSYPGAPEICDGADNDCDGSIDEDTNGADPDDDGVRSACDNCPLDANHDQSDYDSDGTGDSCEPPFGLLNPAEAVPVYPDSAPVRFEWSSGLSKQFKVYWSSLPSFGTPGKSSGDLWSRTTQFTPAGSLWLSILKLGKVTGTIYWRVKSTTQSGTVLTSETRTLLLAPAIAATVTAPADGQVFAGTDPPTTVTWEANHNAAYKIIFSTRADLGGTLKVASGVTYSLHGTSWTLPATAWQKIRTVLAPRNANGTVYYAVLAKDAIGRPTRSPVRSLKVVP